MKDKQKNIIKPLPKEKEVSPLSQKIFSRLIFIAGQVGFIYSHDELMQEDLELIRSSVVQRYVAREKLNLLSEILTENK